MRNLVEYPISVNEVLEELKEIYATESESQIKNGFKFGDMRLLIISVLYDFVNKHTKEFSYLVKKETITLDL